MSDLLKSFGIVIAFLLPGLVGLYSLSYFQPAIREWFGLAAKQEATVGGFLFVVAGSLAMGVFLSGLRFLTIDWIYGKPPAVRSRQRARDCETEKIYQDIRVQHYCFYQFYANMLCAIVLLYFAWFITAWPEWRRAILWLCVVTLTGTVLFLSARDAIHKHDDKVSNLLNPEI